MTRTLEALDARRRARAKPAVRLGFLTVPPGPSDGRLAAWWQSWCRAHGRPDVRLLPGEPYSAILADLAPCRSRGWVLPKAAVEALHAYLVGVSTPPWVVAPIILSRPQLVAADGSALVAPFLPSRQAGRVAAELAARIVRSLRRCEVAPPTRAPR